MNPSPDDAQTRTDLAHAARILAHIGLVNGHGHLSARVSDSTLPEQVVLSTPRGAPSLVSPAEMVGYSSANWQQMAERVPLEAPLHLAVYRARPDVGAIMRMQGTLLDAVGTRYDTLPIVHGRGSHLRRAPRVFPDASPIRDAELGRQVAELLGDGQAAFLRGNGAFTVGVDIPDAVANASYLLETIEIHLARGRDDPPLSFTDEELTARGGGMKGDSSRRSWDFLLDQAGIPMTGALATDPNTGNERALWPS
ncbi:class II aldolase/adducin family protein [Compostimonas suwonensis]|uniref:HCOMODA/2-hydroxy-3-carboxy-muconic semialdehyde decarboxylase n=1 Tax=Compostimonas suwonensis TaxID=1048394 RepID=A0A2M9C4B4_9MICO|nr:class II aldolase/adducin family protein [Compostimonas suwonensis]PJJ65352.1 HCOMODA/2-hydroxy-3-carboxy-muconic semialdehyde decarboxylase [Compostimonas suwonensis]